MTTPLRRRVLAEYIGTAGLVTAVVGSGIAAARLSPADVGLQLFENAAATALALAVLITVLSPVSGAHVNPVVTLVQYWLRPRSDRPSVIDVVAYVAAQILGAVSGAVLANLMFALPAVSSSTTERTGPHLWLAEVVATAGLILVVGALDRAGSRRTAVTVAAYIGAAYWFTSSTAFANPAVTIGRAVTDTFAGIAPSSVPGFVIAQLAGAAIAAVTVAVLCPRTIPSRPAGTPTTTGVGS